MSAHACSDFLPLHGETACCAEKAMPAVCPQCAHHNAATSRAVLVLHAVTLALLGVLVAGGAAVYAEVRRDLDTVRQPHYWVNALLPDGPANVPPAVVSAAAVTLGGAVSQWFLGSVNGTIAAFVQRVATADFASLGQEVQQLSAALLASVATSCPASQSVVCPLAGDYLSCGNGVVYCEYQGQVVNCLPPCEVAQLYEPLSVVQSVASTVATLPAVPRVNDTAADPAFSSGPFALSVVLQWVRAQTALEPWASAAQSCVALADNVMANDWSGAYKDFSGSFAGWNANGQVQSTAQTVRDVCQAIANMTAF